MLKSLYIKNFAIIDQLEIEFCPSLNIITGETGAGKSIIVDALMMLLGERASADLVRQGEAKSIVEGVFELTDSPAALDFLRNNELEPEGPEIIIRREISTKQSSRAFIGDSPVPLSLLKPLGDMIVDFHGQHDHQSLLNPQVHIDLLDSLVADDELKQSYRQLYLELTTQAGRYVDLLQKEKLLKEKAEIQRFQLSEIEKVDPKDGEDQALEEELNIIQNSEQLYLTTEQMYTVLVVGEDSAYDKLVAAEKSLQSLSRIDRRFDDFSGELASAIVSVDEIAKFVKNYNSSIQFSPERIEEIHLRLGQLKGLAKRFGSLQAAIENQAKLKEQLKMVASFDDEIGSLRKSITRLQADLGVIASRLTELRKKAARSLESSMVDFLKTLGIANPNFQVNIGSNPIEPVDRTSKIVCCQIDGRLYEALAKGADIVEFYISTNKGEVVKPLASVASGGEVSRVMLAIKSLAAQADKTPILVFDEIDTGISGRIAQRAAMAMKSLASRCQVIAITHLPQIAAAGDRNIAVEKIESDGRTSVITRMLEGKAKLIELAKLISGEAVTEASLKSAAELFIFDET